MNLFLHCHVLGMWLLREPMSKLGPMLVLLVGPGGLSVRRRRAPRQVEAQGVAGGNVCCRARRDRALVQLPDDDRRRDPGRASGPAAGARDGPARLGAARREREHRSAAGEGARAAARRLLPGAHDVGFYGVDRVPRRCWPDRRSSRCLARTTAAPPASRRSSIGSRPRCSPVTSRASSLLRSPRCLARDRAEGPGDDARSNIAPADVPRAAAIRPACRWLPRSTSARSSVSATRAAPRPASRRSPRGRSGPSTKSRRVRRRRSASRRRHGPRRRARAPIWVTDPRVGVTEFATNGGPVRIAPRRVGPQLVAFTAERADDGRVSLVVRSAAHVDLDGQRIDDGGVATFDVGTADTVEAIGTPRGLVTMHDGLAYAGLDDPA